MNEPERLAKLQRRLGITDDIDGGCIVQRYRDPSWSDAQFGAALGALGVVIGAVIAVGGAIFSRKRGSSSAPDGTPPLPDGRLALAVVGDEVLVGWNGKVLRRYPAGDVLPTIARPRLAGEITLDGEMFEAEGLQGDYLLRLRRGAH